MVYYLLHSHINGYITNRYIIIIIYYIAEIHTKRSDFRTLSVD